MNEIVIVTGIPGVGKTTVVNHALELIKNEYEIINYGDMMFKHAKTANLVSDRDQMRKLNPNDQKTIQIKAAEEIYELSEKKSVLVDTHCTIKTKKGLLPGLPQWVLEKLKPTAIVLVEASNKDIANRRASDKSRARDPDSEQDIADHQDMNRNIAMAYSVTSGATVSVVINNDGKVDEASKKLSEVL